MVKISLADYDSDQKLRGAQSDADLFVDKGLVKVESIDQSTRAVSQTARGVLAARKLLAGAQKVETRSKKFRKYRKDGNYETALADFNSVKPVLRKKDLNRIAFGESWKRQKYYDSNKLHGSVGNIRLVLKKAGDNYSEGSPVLEIRSVFDALYDRIEYKTNGN